MEAVWSSETSYSLWTTWHYNPKDCTLHGHRCGNPKSNIYIFYYCFRLNITWYRYTLRFYIYYMFRPDVAIFRYIRSQQSPVSFSATLPTLTSVFTLGVHYMYCFMWCHMFWNVLNVEYLKCWSFLFFAMLKIGIKIKINIRSVLKVHTMMLKYISSISNVCCPTIFPVWSHWF
jgi:hypothetical protein